MFIGTQYSLHSYCLIHTLLYHTFLHLYIEKYPIQGLHLTVQPTVLMDTNLRLRSVEHTKMIIFIIHHLYCVL